MKSLEIEFPGEDKLRISHLLLDFNGTIAKDGALLPEVERRLIELAKIVTLIVLTADTQGTALYALKALPVEAHLVHSGAEKARFLESLKTGSALSIAAIGNGRNDIEMFRSADLAIAVLGPEGLASDLIPFATVVTLQITDALDLLLLPKRLIGTLRA